MSMQKWGYVLLLIYIISHRHTNILSTHHVNTYYLFHILSIYVCFHTAVIPDLGALPTYKCNAKKYKCKQGAECTVRWTGERVCGSVGTVVMSCMKHSIADPVRLCKAEEQGCICS